MLQLLDDAFDIHLPPVGAKLPLVGEDKRRVPEENVSKLVTPLLFLSPFLRSEIYNLATASPQKVAVDSDILEELHSSGLNIHGEMDETTSKIVKASFRNRSGSLSFRSPVHVPYGTIFCPTSNAHSIALLDSLGLLQGTKATSTGELVRENAELFHNISTLLLTATDYDHNPTYGEVLEFLEERGFNKRSQPGFGSVVMEAMRSATEVESAGSFIKRLFE